MKYLFSFLLLLSCYAGAVACPTTGYAQTYDLPINSQSSISADASNFIMYMKGDALFKTSANGGQSLSTGLDIVWCDSPTGSILPYELAPGTFSATTGAADWWILVPTVSKTVLKHIYAKVGKASDTDHSCGPSGTANCGTTLYAGLKSVYHCGNSGSVSVVDATTNTSPTNNGLANGTPPSSFSSTGGGCYTGNSAWMDTNSTQTSTAYTVVMWVNQSTASGTQAYIQNLNPGGFGSNSTSGFGVWGGSNVAVVVGGSGGQSGCATASYPFSTSTWGMIAASYNGGTASSTSSYSIYANGSSTSCTMFATGTSALVAPVNTMRVAASVSCCSLSNAFDEVFTFNSSISADTRYLLYANQSSPTTFYGSISGYVPTTSSPNPCLFIICD